MRRALLLVLVTLAASCTQRPTCASDCDCWGPGDDACAGEWRCVIDECFYECRQSCASTGACEAEGEHCSPESGLCSQRTECTDGLGGAGG